MGSGRALGRAWTRPWGREWGGRPEGHSQVRLCPLMIPDPEEAFERQHGRPTIRLCPGLRGIPASELQGHPAVWQEQRPGSASELGGLRSRSDGLTTGYGRGKVPQTLGCLSVYSSICLHIDLSTHLLAHLFIHIFTKNSTCASIHLPI